MADPILSMQAHSLTTAHTCLRLLGHMAACTNIVQHKQLHLRLLQTWLTSVYVPNRHSMDHVVKILDHVLLSLAWWKNPASVLKGVPSVNPPLLVTVISDASDLRVGSPPGQSQRTRSLSSLDHSLHISVTWPAMLSYLT